MADLFKKLTVLVRASLSEPGSGDAPSVDRPRLNRQIQRDLASLHERINDAHDYQRQLRERGETLNTEIDRITDEMDAARRDGQSEHLRYLAEQRQRAMQRLSITEADLAEHERLTADLVQNVRALEQMVEAAGQQKTSPAADVPATSGETDRQDSLNTLRESLRQARQKIDPASEPAETDAAPPPAQPLPAEDDLERRRQRLSKR